MPAPWQCHEKRAMGWPACGSPAECHIGKWRPEPGPGDAVTVESGGCSVHAALHLPLTVATPQLLRFLLAMRALLRFMGSCRDPPYMHVCVRACV